MKEPDSDPQQLVIPTRVVVRDSTAACPLAGPSGLPATASLAYPREI